MARTSILHRLPLGRVHAGMPEWLRVTIGTEAENRRFLQALETARG